MATSHQPPMPLHCAVEPEHCAQGRLRAGGEPRAPRRQVCPIRGANPTRYFCSPQPLEGCVSLSSAPKHFCSRALEPFQLKHICKDWRQNPRGLLPHARAHAGPVPAHIRALARRDAALTPTPIFIPAAAVGRRAARRGPTRAPTAAAAASAPGPAPTAAAAPTASRRGAAAVAAMPRPTRAAARRLVAAAAAAAAAPTPVLIAATAPTAAATAVRQRRAACRRRRGGATASRGPAAARRP